MNRVAMTYRSMINRPCRPVNRRLLHLAALVLGITLACASAAFGIQEGQSAPDFKIPDLQGNIRALDDFSGKVTVVLFWRPEAERARAAVCEVSEALRSDYEDARFFTIVSGEHERADIETVLKRCAKSVPVLLDTDRKAFASYQIIALPTLMILSSDHAVKYKEAGFSHEGISSLTNKLDEIYGRKQPEPATLKDSPEAIRRYGLAMQFLKKGLNERAEQLLTQLVQDHPEYRPSWVSLGYQKIASGKVEESQRCLEKAHSLDRNNPDVAAGLAWVWWKQGNGAQSAKWTAMVGGDDPNRSLILEIRENESVQ